MRINPIDWQQLRDLGRSEVLTEAGVARVSMLTRGRNAWHSTWVRHYQGPTAMFTNLIAAKRAAEPLRERGNVFYVTEAPALVLRGRRFTSVLVDFHPVNPFARYRGFDELEFLPGERMTHVLRTFNHDSGFWDGPLPSQHSIRTGQVNDARNLSSLGKDPLRTYKSYARETGYLLGWREMPNRFSTEGVQDLVSVFSCFADLQPGHGELLREAKSLASPLPDAPEIFRNPYGEHAS
jgi:hypothetical protein